MNKWQFLYCIPWSFSPKRVRKCVKLSWEGHSDSKALMVLESASRPAQTHRLVGYTSSLSYIGLRSITFLSFHSARQLNRVNKSIHWHPAYKSHHMRGFKTNSSKIEILTVYQNVLTIRTLTNAQINNYVNLTITSISIVTVLSQTLETRQR